MVNDEAAHLLGIPQTSTGRLVGEVDEARLAGIFEGTDEVTDRVVPFQGRLVTVNRMPVFSHGRHIGWVATLRDRTEMLELSASSTSPGAPPTPCAPRPTSSATACTSSAG